MLLMDAVDGVTGDIAEDEDEYIARAEDWRLR